MEKFKAHVKKYGAYYAIVALILGVVIASNWDTIKGWFPPSADNEKFLTETDPEYVQRVSFTPTRPPRLCGTCPSGGSIYDAGQGCSGWQKACGK